MQYLETIPGMKKRAPISATERVPAADRERGKRMLAAREARGLTQNAVAVKLAIEKTTVWRWEKGITSPREDIERLAKLYGTTPAYLLYGVGSETEEAPPYAAWTDFESWLSTAPEGKMAERWMLEDLRAMRFSNNVEPTLETYTRLLFALVSMRSPSR